MQPTALPGTAPAVASGRPMPPAASAGAQVGHPAHPGQQASSEVSTSPAQGWHVSHLFYRFDRSRLAALAPEARAEGMRMFCEALDPAGPLAPTRLQLWLVPGHKADFGVMAMDPAPLKVDDVHQRLLAGPLGQSTPTASTRTAALNAVPMPAGGGGAGGMLCVFGEEPLR